MFSVFPIDVTILRINHMQLEGLWYEDLLLGLKVLNLKLGIHCGLFQAYAFVLIFTSIIGQLIKALMLPDSGLSKH